MSIKKPISTLDNDIIFTEILPRLPAKSLIRFKCVSKSFNSIISSRHFSKLHLRYNPSDILILPGNRRINCHDLDSTTASETFTWPGRDPITVVGSANGILCIYSLYAINHLTVLNPTTRVYRDIFIPAFPSFRDFIGFLFDHQNHDFKIVRVYDASHHGPVFRIRVTKVYSFNNNSWDLVDEQVRTDTMEGYSGTLVNNHLLHWMFWNHSLHKLTIGCFDACKNKWVDDVLLPHYYHDPSENKVFLLDIGVLDNRLFASFQTVGHSCDVWLMKEYGVQDSWIKLFNIPTVNGVGIPEGVVPLASRVLVGDILLQLRHTTWLSWYNLIDGGMSDAKYDGMSDAKYDGTPGFSKLQVSICARSQADIPGGKLFGEPLELAG